MDYHKLSITVDIKYLETTEAICQMVVPYGFQTEDYSDVESLLAIMPRELIDESLLQMDRTKAKVNLFIPTETSPAEALSYVESQLNQGGIPYTVATGLVHESEYANAWKKYFKPLRVGKTLMVVPSWETYMPEKTDVVIDLDPGMAFGTGAHETTRLCMDYLEELVRPDSQMLDIGTGSGILAITAIKLGASLALGTDIDPVAVTVARENAKRNGVTENIQFIHSDLTTGVEGVYDIVCANIVADAVISLSKQVGQFLKPGGIYLVSGIIDTRAEEVRAALLANGFHLVSEKTDGGWVAIAGKRG